MAHHGDDSCRILLVLLLPQKTQGWEFFVPAQTLIVTYSGKAVNSLPAMVIQELPLFYKFLWSWVTSTNFVRSQHLIARKFAELLLQKAISQCHNLIFYTQIDDHGILRGNTGQIHARCRRPVASRVALDLPYWAMRLASYHLICMAIEMASKLGAFCSVIDFMSCINVVKRPC